MSLFSLSSWFANNNTTNSKSGAAASVTDVFQDVERWVADASENNAGVQGSTTTEGSTASSVSGADDSKFREAMRQREADRESFVLKFANSRLADFLVTGMVAYQIHFKSCSPAMSMARLSSTNAIGRCTAEMLVAIINMQEQLISVRTAFRNIAVALFELDSRSAADRDDPYVLQSFRQIDSFLKNPRQWTPEHAAWFGLSDLAPMDAATVDLLNNITGVSHESKRRPSYDTNSSASAAAGPTDAEPTHADSVAARHNRATVREIALARKAAAAHAFRAARDPPIKRDYQARQRSSLVSEELDVEMKAAGELDALDDGRKSGSASSTTTTSPAYPSLAPASYSSARSRIGQRRVVDDEPARDDRSSKTGELSEFACCVLKLPCLDPESAKHAWCTAREVDVTSQGVALERLTCDDEDNLHYIRPVPRGAHVLVCKEHADSVALQELIKARKIVYVT